MCNEAIYSAVEQVAQQRLSRATPRCLDIGAGSGDLLALLRKTWPDMQAEACDYHTERFALKDVAITHIDLNIHPLPYADGSFDLVTCSEVLEHVFAPLVWMGWRQFLRLEQNKYGTLGRGNEPHVMQHNSPTILAGRTLVVSAIK